MRDAFGGTFMIMIFLVFIMIYISFTAVALNYAKAFKTKNAIIDYLENSEIESLDKITVEKEEDFERFIDEEIIGKYKYTINISDYCTGFQERDQAGNKIGICNDVGFKIEEVGRAENTEGIYYKVSTALGWNIGFFKNLATLNGGANDPDAGGLTGYWEITGETRLIVNKN